MEIRVLGPVEVRTGAGPVRLARRQQRLVLGILALRANTPVSGERLMDLMWGDDAPRQARAVLQTRVSEVRSLIAGPAEETRLVTRGSGYMLQGPPEAIDAHRFQALVAEALTAGGSERTREMLREALGLWRGPALGDDLATAEQEALVHGLESARLTAAEHLYDVELRLGNHLAVVEEILALAAANPTRERLIGQAMLALHRSGRTTEALREYERHRTWLSEELGIDPAPPVQALHRTIMRGEDAMATPDPGGCPVSPARAVPRTLPLDVGDFTGRDAEVAALREALASGTGVVAVVGQAGVGKTALAVHVAHLLREAYPDGQLYVDLKGWADDAPVPPEAVLGRFLRVLGMDDAAVPQSLDERAAMFRDAMARRRMLLVLDNAASTRQVVPLLPGDPGCGVILTARARLGEALGATTLSLDVMDERQAGALLLRICGAARAGGPDVRLLCRQCGYLPLAIRVAGATLAAKPHWSVAKLAELLREERGRLDHFVYGHHDVRASIALSYPGLSEPARRLLRRACDLDVPDIPLWMAAALLDRPAAEAEAVLEELFDAQLLDAVSCDAAGDARYRAHDLVRLFARERATLDEPPEDLHAARDRYFDAWLQLTYRGYLRLRGEGSWIRPQSQGYRPERRFLETAGRDPRGWIETERHHLSAAVAEAARTGRARQCADLLALATPLYSLDQHFDECLRIVESALGPVRACGTPRDLAVALLAMNQIASVWTRWMERADVYAVEAIDLLDAAGERHGWAVAVALRIPLHRNLGREDAAIEAYHRCAPVLLAHGDPGQLAFAQRHIALIHMRRGEFEAADELLDEAAHNARDAGHRVMEASLLCWRGMLRLEQRRHADARADFEEARLLSRAIGDRNGEVQCMRGLGLYHQRTGDSRRARQLLLDALGVTHQPVPTHLEHQVMQSMATLR